MKAEADSDDQLTSDEDRVPLAKKAKKEPAQTKKVSDCVSLVTGISHTSLSRKTRRYPETSSFVPHLTARNTLTWERRNELL